MSHRVWHTIAAAIAIVCIGGWSSAGARDEVAPDIAKSMYVVHTAAGDASVPIETSLDLTAVHPEITRAAIVFHGKGRNVEGYFRALERAAAAAGPTAARTLLLAPQFLREADAEAYHLPDKMLRWHLGDWSAGLPAIAPQSLSSFDVIDALLSTLADRGRFPNLHAVVLVGHSAGAQLINRYAIVGRQPAALEATGIHVRFLIANPSSYLYFSDDRPQRDGTFADPRGGRCPGFNRWRYGPDGAPPYVLDTSGGAWQQRESAYAAADVIYLLGTADTDPAQVDLDTSCAGEAQGPERFDRGTGLVRCVYVRRNLVVRSSRCHRTGRRSWLRPLGRDHFGGLSSAAGAFSLRICSTASLGAA